METAITIPKRLVAEKDLVMIPRHEYEEFSFWKKAVKIQLDEKWFWSQEWQQKEAQADRDIKAGRVKGPFSNYKDLMASLKRKDK